MIFGYLLQRFGDNKLTLVLKTKKKLKWNNLHFSLSVCAIGTTVITFGDQLLDEDYTETYTPIQKGTK